MAILSSVRPSPPALGDAPRPAGEAGRGGRGERVGLPLRGAACATDRRARLGRRRVAAFEATLHSLVVECGDGDDRSARVLVVAQARRGKTEFRRGGSLGSPTGMPHMTARGAGPRLIRGRARAPRTGRAERRASGRRVRLAEDGPLRCGDANAPAARRSGGARRQPEVPCGLDDDGDRANVEEPLVRRRRRRRPPLHRRGRSRLRGGRAGGQALNAASPDSCPLRERWRDRHSRAPPLARAARRRNAR
jgi:hypothetical protein